MWNSKRQPYTLKNGYQLTKSKYVRGLQCLKALYYDVYEPKLARYDPETLKKFTEGRDFEATYKATYPMGIALDAELGKQMGLYPRRTAELIAQQGEVVVFEAGFLYDEVLVLADVMVKHADGAIDIYEVKNNSEAKEVFLHDSAVQHYVISHSTAHLRTFNLVNNDGAGGFRITDVTERCKAEAATVAANIPKFKAVLAAQEPSTAMGTHCDTPYPCPYKDHCTKLRLW